MRICSGSASLQREHAASYCMSLRGAKRRDNPFSLQYHKTENNTLGKYVRRNEFARTAANLLGISAGTRIATPVCALVRNDMQKEGRVRGCKNVGRNDMQKVGRRARVQGRLARGHAETWQVCAGQGRNDMLKTGKCSRLQGRFPAVPPGKRRHAANFWMSLRGAERRGNPHLLRQGVTESSALGESEKHYEFALRITNL